MHTCIHYIHTYIYPSSYIHTYICIYSLSLIDSSVVRKRAKRITQPVKAFWLDPTLRLERDSIQATEEFVATTTSTSKLNAGQQIKNINNTATIVSSIKNNGNNINNNRTTPLLSPIPVAVFGAGKDFIVDREGVEETAAFLGVKPVFIPDLYHDVWQMKSITSLINYVMSSLFKQLDPCLCFLLYV